MPALVLRVHLPVELCFSSHVIELKLQRDVVVHHVPGSIHTPNLVYVVPIIASWHSRHALPAARAGLLWTRPAAPDDTATAPARLAVTVPLLRCLA
jgi:hypothetical protein